MRPFVPPLILVAAIFGSIAPANGFSIDTNDSNDGIVLEHHEFKPPEDRSDDKGGGNRLEAQPAPEPEPCTLSGVLLACLAPVEIPVEAAPPAGAVFTPGMARQAVATLPMPGLALQVQPNGETLVNVRTIFWADPQPVQTSFNLLGHTIEVEATPSSFTWMHGDGTSQTTTEPGRPYPSLDITHRYLQPGQLGASVVTTYDVRYSVDGGGWTDLGTPLVAPGPATPIDVHEAAPVLAP